MNALVGLEQIRRKLLKQYTVGDIVPADDWSLEQSLDTAWNRAKLMDSLERLDRRSSHLFEAALKGGE
jgi:hypothetical protein